MSVKMIYNEDGTVDRQATIDLFLAQKLKGGLTRKRNKGRRYSLKLLRAKDKSDLTPAELATYNEWEAFKVSQLKAGYKRRNDNYRRKKKLRVDGGSVV